MSNKGRTLTEEEMKNIAGGDSNADIFFERIYQYIVNGQADEARYNYRCLASKLSDDAKRKLKALFKNKFGYPID